MATPADAGFNPYEPPGHADILEPVADRSATLRGFAAGWRRYVAQCVDNFVFALLCLPPYLVLVVLDSQGDPGREINLEEPADLMGVALILGFLALLVVGSIVYSAALEASRWQATPGKLALGLRVTDLEGRRISFGRGVLRWLGKLAANLTCGIGYLMMLWTERGQALEDKLAGTLVVRAR